MPQNLEHLKLLVAGQSVALVGNAQSLLAGPAVPIDAHDVVVRINRGVVVAAAHPGIGKRTDILLVSAFERDMDELIKSAPCVVYMSPAKRDRLSNEQHARLHFYPEEWWQTLLERIGSRPSTGCMGIDLLSRLIGPDSLHLYGFDFWQSPTSYTGINRPGPHTPGAEEQFARSLIPEQNIH